MIRVYLKSVRERDDMASGIQEIIPYTRLTFPAEQRYVMQVGANQTCCSIKDFDLGGVTLSNGYYYTYAEFLDRCVWRNGRKCGINPGER